MGSRILNDGLTVLKCAGFVIAAPSRWKGNDWLLASGIIAGTGTVSLLDQSAYDLMERNHTQVNDQLQEIGAEYGAFLDVMLISGGMYVAGLISDDGWVRGTGVLMGGALLTTAVMSSVVKFTVGRARPYTGLSNHQFRPFRSDGDYKSFPSGHTVAAFTLSAVLAERIKNTWATVGLYGLAGVTAASRMYSRNHWLSDVFFSGLCSSLVARSIVHWYESGGKEGDEVAQLSIIPCANGILIMWRF
jgi:hypothetical protein